MITEADASGNTLRAEIYAGSRHLATWSNNATYFNHADWLGTERVRSFGSGQQAGQACEKITSLPFGDGMNPQALNGGCGGSGDPSPNHFTGKERDSESGLDYFGARYDASSLGRFMTPDEGVDQHPQDPQSWNLYVYGRSNPVSLVDPGGEYICGSSMSQEQCDTFQKGLDTAQQAANALKEQYGANSQQYKDAQRAIDAYGKENIDNGVTVNIGDTKGYAAQTDPHIGTTAKTEDNPLGQRVNVTFSADAVGNARAEVHEGSHVADASAWVASGFSAAMNPTRFQTEFRAYHVETNIGQAMGDVLTYSNFRNQFYFLTVRGWSSTSTDNAIKYMIKRLYNLSPVDKVKTFLRNTRGAQ